MNDSDDTPAGSEADGFNGNDAPERWNMFARVLDEIMATRGKSIGHIDDHTTIHRQKVARVQRSLLDPGRIHMLNPNELDQVITAFALTSDEALRLRAAVVAASIQKTLLDRISPQDARQAADELYPTVLDAMRQRARQSRGVGSIRGIGKHMALPSVESEQQREREVLQQALAAAGNAHRALLHARAGLSERASSLASAQHDLKRALMGVTALLTQEDDTEDSATSA